MAKGKVAISKTVPTAAIGYDIIIIIIIPTEYKNHHRICESVGGRWLKTVSISDKDFIIKMCI